MFALGFAPYRFCIIADFIARDGETA